jgi:hypothetical protein
MLLLKLPGRVDNNKKGLRTSCWRSLAPLNCLFCRLPILLTLLLYAFAQTGCSRPPASQQAQTSKPAQGPIEIFVSPDGKWVAEHRLNEGHSLLRQVSGGADTPLPDHLRFNLPAVASPWSLDSRYLLLSDRQNTDAATFVLWEVGTGTQMRLSMRGAADGAAALLSPDNRYVAAGFLPSSMANDRDDLMLWDTQKTQMPQYQVLSFSGSVYALVWIASDQLLVFTGRSQNNKRIREIFQVAAPSGKQNRIASFDNGESMLPAPYADSAKQILMIVGSKKQYRCTRLNPVSGQMTEIASLPKDTQMVKLLWSSPDRIYLWRLSDQNQAETQVYNPRKGALSPPQRADAWLQPTADSTGHLWGLKDGILSRTMP